MNEKWHPDAYLANMLDNIVPEHRFQAKTPEDWREWRDVLRREFVSLLGGFPQTRAELQPTVLETADCGTYIRSRVELTTYAGLRMPVYVLTPTRRKQKSPAVIACHGHGYGSKELVGLHPDGTERDGDPGYQKNFALELVNRGFVTLVPELLGFGDRKLSEEVEAYSSCDRISTFLLAMGQTMAGHRVYETLRCVDYLCTLDDVDAGRIGIMGISGGGLVGSYAAALDDRIGAAVVSGFVNTFKASILSIRHCVDNFVPGLSLAAEMPDLIGLIAPRPLLVESGEHDPIFPVQAVREAYEKLGTIYSMLEVRERLEHDIFSSGHEISGVKAYDWLERWLA